MTKLLDLGRPDFWLFILVHIAAVWLGFVLGHEYMSGWGIGMLTVIFGSTTEPAILIPVGVLGFIFGLISLAIGVGIVPKRAHWEGFWLGTSLILSLVVTAYLTCKVLEIADS